MDESTSKRSVTHCLFTLEGQNFVLMEGKGEHRFTFNEAFSLVIECKTQREIDSYWSKLSDGGSEGSCGWIKDKYGVSWQIVPSGLGKMMSSSDTAKVDSVMKAVLEMEKIDIKKLQQAFKGSLKRT